MARPMTLMFSFPTKPPPSRPFPYRPHTYRAIDIPRQCFAQIELIPHLPHLCEFLPVKLDTVSTQESTTIFPLWRSERTAIDMLHLEILHVPFRIEGCRAALGGDQVTHGTNGVTMREMVFYTGRSDSLLRGSAGLRNCQHRVTRGHD